GVDLEAGGGGEPPPAFREEEVGIGRAPEAGGRERPPGAEARAGDGGEGVAGKKVRTVGDIAMRKAMVKKGDPQLSVRRQCELLGVNRNRLDREPPKAEAEDL